MSKTVVVKSPAEFSNLLKTSKIVVTDFYADWCGPCKAIAPMYEQLSAQLSRPNKITFTKVNVDDQTEIASTYGITAMPTFMIFKGGKQVEKVQGADPKKLQDIVRKLAAEADDSGDSSSGFASGSGSGDWRAGALPRGYNDVTDQVDIKGLELLNADSEFGTVRTLVDTSKPSALSNGKAADSKTKDWVVSDTDEQLMLFMPFQSMLKVHSVQITSLPSASDNEGEDDEEPMRPKTIKIYTNRAHTVGFDEAEGLPETQTITLEAKDWDSTGTATLSLRFVKFQNVTSLVFFIVDGDGDSEKVRIDRIRIIGETGEKRDPGKLEKIDHDH
ncbi:putative thioredoxin protein [Botrytis fragariae]|uniref:Putative thioredoxin protein n=1 Tax=Botrytis fragariae TaxID=1964551 RepID=A0A8H6B2N4_9HELO|nr:putative thioredoxin protein [Botrytis fragariae]KAF5878015.1 putative thioredoxin protein [Botrytis fragariae]